MNDLNPENGWKRIPDVDDLVISEQELNEIEARINTDPDLIRLEELGKIEDERVLTASEQAELDHLLRHSRYSDGSVIDDTEYERWPIKE